MGNPVTNNKIETKTVVLVLRRSVAILEHDGQVITGSACSFPDI